MYNISAWVWRIKGLARDGSAKLLWRDQIFRCERGQGKYIFLFLVDPNFPESADYAYINTHTTYMPNGKRLVSTLFSQSERGGQFDPSAKALVL